MIKAVGFDLLLCLLFAVALLLSGLFVAQILCLMQQITHDYAQQCFYCLAQISLKTDADLHVPTEASATAASQSDCFTQRNSLFHKEVLQVTFAQFQQVVTVILPVLSAFLSIFRSTFQ